MGQKAHPTGLRLGISNNWSSKWNFDPKQNKNSSYREMLQLDLEIQRVIGQIFKSSKAFLAKVAIHKSPNLNVYDIYISAFLPQERHAFKTSKLKHKFYTQINSEVFKRILQGVKNNLKSKYPSFKFNIHAVLLDQKDSQKQHSRNSIQLQATRELRFIARKPWFNTLLAILLNLFKTKNPQVLASFIARNLEKTRFQRAIFQGVSQTVKFIFAKDDALKGIRIQIKGRLNKSKRTQKYVIQCGQVPSQTLTVPVFYATDEANTFYGSMGVKIWIA